MTDMTTGFTTLSVERDGAIVHVQLQRPEKLNAQTHEMWFELRQLGRQIGQDNSIRALILSGAGRSFSAGLDTAVLTDFLGAERPADLVGVEGPELVSRVQEGFTWLNEAPYPTIAAVQGHAFGAGCQLALACDLRIAAENAVFALAETNWGLMPDLGGTVWLPQLVGPARAKEIMWLADRVDATEAHRIGLVNRVVPVDVLHAEARALADRLAKRPPLALTAVKRAVQASLTDQAAGLAEAGAGQIRCLASADLIEAGTAFIEGREPAYTGT
jgi:enoyl-CoA hydratase/carnithine racemase